MSGRLWLGLVWLLLARAPGAAGTPNSPRRARSYPHLEGDVRWRRLFSSTHFFLRVDTSGRVQGTRWRHGADSIIEIRSIRVGVVVLKAVHTGFYVAMNRRGRLYGSVPRAHRGERLQHLRLAPLASPWPAHVPGTGWAGGPTAWRPDTAAPPVHPLPARPGLLRPQVCRMPELHSQGPGAGEVQAVAKPVWSLIFSPSIHGVWARCQAGDTAGPHGHDLTPRSA
ncbi:fibroblast growth factor 22 isoform X1 [Lutra lutra]|uniref:fibroblast growth factor 22 isoform X1 n=1 Tax=Lutra lutra TaxID=9657 RepID=UPI001FD357D4|nr:fibroblast growth factor 22 isoform X1 [Lutra lutra]